MHDLVHTLVEKSKMKSPFIVGISGIDGSGKGYVGNQIAQAIKEDGRTCELIGIDGWLHPPDKRFSPTEPGHHFYTNGFRFDDMHQQLFLPLSKKGSIDVWVKHSDPGNSLEMVDFHYQIDGADIIIFEGIFLIQQRFSFDYTIWVECSFETALKRALTRNQEGLPDEEIIRDYNTIYFPAQRIHLANDNPRGACDYILLNDDLKKSDWP